MKEGVEGDGMDELAWGSGQETEDGMRVEVGGFPGREHGADWGPSVILA